MAVRVDYGGYSSRYTSDAKGTLGQLMTLMAKGKMLGPRGDLRPITMLVMRWNMSVHEAPVYVVRRLHADFAHVYHVTLTP